MFKIDKVRMLFDCDLCTELLVDPVKLPCGYSVCKRHLDEQFNETSTRDTTFECKICQNEHSLPKEGFLVNKRLKNGIEMELNTLKLNPVYVECKKLIEEAKGSLSKMETNENDPENLIYEYFEDIKRKVDIRREDLKMRIDICSNEIIQSIDRTQRDCVNLSKQTKKINSEIDKLKKEFAALIDRFDTFDIDEKKFIEIKQEALVMNEAFNQKLWEQEDSLIGYKKYFFDFKEIQVHDVFGYFSGIETVILLSIFLN